MLSKSHAIMKPTHPELELSGSRGAAGLEASGLSLCRIFDVTCRAGLAFVLTEVARGRVTCSKACVEANGSRLASMSNPRFGSQQMDADGVTF